MCKTSYYLLLFLLGYFITYLTKLHFIMTSQNYNGNLYLLNNGKKKTPTFSLKDVNILTVFIALNLIIVIEKIP